MISKFIPMAEVEVKIAAADEVSGRPIVDCSPIISGTPHGGLIHVIRRTGASSGAAPSTI